MRWLTTGLRLIRWGQLRTVHGRETSGNEAMARPLGLAKERCSEPGNKGGLQLASHKRQNVTKREKGPDWLGGFLLRGARINQSTRPAKSKPVRGSHDNPGAKTLGKTEKKSTVRNPERELEDLTFMGTSIISSRNGATGPDSNPPSGPGEQEKPTLRLRQHRSDWPHHERSERDTSVQVRGNDHRLPTHQTTLPLGRDDWKARIRTEGDSKAPSASIASSTCRNAGVRGKQTWNVVTTPGSVRGEEKSRKGTR